MRTYVRFYYITLDLGTVMADQLKVKWEPSTVGGKKVAEYRSRIHPNKTYTFAYRRYNKTTGVTVSYCSGCASVRNKRKRKREFIIILSIYVKPMRT